MVGFRRLRSRINELNGKYFSINGSILFIFVMVLTHEPYYVKSLGTESIQIICSESKTCTKCTNKTLCSWSIEKQTCMNTKQISGSMTIHNETHCPQFSVVKRSSVVDVSFKFTVKISNDVKDFINFLSKSTITCCLESCYFKGSVVNDEIVCETIRTPASYFSKYTKAMISYVYIMFDNLELKFDNDTDYYYTIYDRECINESERDDCVTCLWNDDDYRYYLKWCSSNNQCMGSYKIYEKRVIDDNKKFRYIEDNVHIKCPDIKIQSIEPTWALWTGSTTMTITVRNHWILVETLQTIIVTVAGRNCVDPQTLDKDTIKCIIMSPKGVDANWTKPEAGAEMQRSNYHGHVHGGPVEVVYASSTTFTVQSTTTVNFVDPVITDISPVCGPAAGGTLLTVRGKFLDADGCTVRVSVGDVSCEPAAQYPGGITCRTGPSTVSGVVRVELVQHRQTATALSMYGPVYVYMSDPVLDADQSFGGIVAGGIAIPVHGRSFATGCGNDIVNATFYVDDHSGARHYASADCLVKNDSCMMCRTPKLQHQRIPGRDAPTDVTSSLISLHNFGVTVVVRRRRWPRDSANVKSPEVLIDETLDLIPPPSSPSNFSAANKFFLYSDPMYDDFEIDNNDSAALVINSRGDAGQGYRTSDVTIRFRNSTVMDSCTVISMNQRRIVCRVTSASTVEAAIDLNDLRSIVVSVGDGLAYNVHKKITDRYNNNNYYTLKLFTTASSCGIVVVIVVILLIISVILIHLKTKNRYVVSNCQS